MPFEPAPTVHSLCRLKDLRALEWLTEEPPWAAGSLHRARWVVVRRAVPRPSSWPVGVRGAARTQRAAAWLPSAAVAECLTPPMLAAARPWKQQARSSTPVLAVLDEVAAIFAALGLAGRWGPTGSTGFELASGVRVTHAASDLDLAVIAADPLSRECADRLHRALSELPVRTDVQVETPQGAVHLMELAQGAQKVLLRSAHGVRLTCDPWCARTAETMP